MAEVFEIDTPSNKIVGIASIPKDAEKCPCVVLCHGLISSKESSKYVALAENLNGAGIATCRFDFHGCGESSGNIEDTTLTIRISNLSSIIGYLLRHDSVDPDRIGILGSSFGGSTCIVKAARDPRIKCVALWATPHKLEKSGDGRISDIQFKDAIYKDFSTYDLLAEGRNISNALVIHGEMDETVPCSEGKAIYKEIKKPKKLEVMKGADHIFSNPTHRDKAINLSMNWFRRYLLGA